LQYLEIFQNRRIATVLLLGFASGLPLALTGSTLQAWFSVSGVDILTIGMFSLVSLPYALKFLWAPLLDRYAPPGLGRRRGWMLVTQLSLVIFILAMGACSPADTTWTLGVLAVMIAFASASQDVVFDAYRTDLLAPRERGAGAAVTVLGYRTAMLVSGALALVLSEHLGWRNTYWLMAGLMIVGMGASLLGPEPEGMGSPPRDLGEAVVKPFKDFFARSYALPMLLLIMLYKFGDAFAGTLTTAFLIQDVGFSVAEVGYINKAFGFVATIAGALLGGMLMVRLSLYQALLWFGFLQAVSNLSFILLTVWGRDIATLICVVAFENLSAGMGTAAFVALLMGLCNKSFSATQYALLSALASIARVFLGPVAAGLVSTLGWSYFFVITFFSALPGVGLLWLLRHRIDDRKESVAVTD
jgi:PAT family beta-lactamase induction signal transducer AmpG